MFANCYGLTSGLSGACIVNVLNSGITNYRSHLIFLGADRRPIILDSMIHRGVIIREGLFFGGAADCKGEAKLWCLCRIYFMVIVYKTCDVSMNQ